MRPVVKISLRSLPRPYFPVALRRGGATVMFIDPSAQRAEIALAAIDALTPAENDVVRMAFGWPPAGLGPTPEDAVSDLPCLLYVPPELRMPDEDPIQGGAELARRIRHGVALDDEIALLWEEDARAGARFEARYRMYQGIAAG